jgi:uracil-DNA glycosylase family 4
MLALPEIKPYGPSPARIMLVGDFPGPDDEQRCLAFQGTAGYELGKMLHEAGILRTECYHSVVLRHRPLGGNLEGLFDKKKRTVHPKISEGIAKLEEEIAQVQPHIIVALGDLALFALYGETSVDTWRGSLLQHSSGAKLIPTYSPASVQRNWEWRAVAVHDLRKVLRESESRAIVPPDYHFLIRPTASEVLGTISMLLARAEGQPSPLKLAVDLETRAGMIACNGIAWSPRHAICIPHMCVERPEGFYSEDEEIAIALAVRDLLTHSNVKVVGQNFLFDAQYFAKELGYVPNLRDDTMFQQHILFPGMPKGLDFLASMYAEYYVYWKGEGKLWDPKVPEDQLWQYNCKDACYTWEISETLQPSIDMANLREQYEFQMQLWWTVLRMMLRGVRIDKNLRQQLAGELLAEIQEREARMQKVLGHPINIRSPKQMATLFYGDLKLPPQYQKKGKRNITTDDKAMVKLGQIEPIVKPLCDIVRELRSCGVFLSTFIQAALDSDGRMRCSYNPTGTETFRFNSSENAFGTGTNLQNIPKGDEDNDHEEGALVLPNIRKIFVPDPEYLIFDVDLAGADAQVVAWEADDEELKDVFRAGIKLHAHNAKTIFGGNAGADGKKEPYYTRAKMGVHATNYGARPRTVAIALGITVHEAEHFQRRWFQAHPGIAEWHKRTEASLQRHRSVSNKFGYRKYYFDRIENCLPQALAWVPQSTVAIVTNRALVAVDTALPEVELLLQVHDSIVGQALKAEWWRVKPRLRDALQVTIPYPDPLTINFSMKTSVRNWGAAEDEKW